MTRTQGIKKDSEEVTDVSGEGGSCKKKGETKGWNKPRERTQNRGEELAQQEIPLQKEDLRAAVRQEMQMFQLHLSSEKVWISRVQELSEEH